MNIYVANISFKATNSDLKELFEEYGDVSSAKIIIDKDSQRSRGFGFVEMANDAEARQAITELNGANFQGKDVNVTEARPKSENSGSGGFGNRGGGGYGNKRW